MIRDGNMPSLRHAGRDAVSASPIPSGNVRYLDLTDFDAVRREFQKDKPQLIIHCAAVSTLAAAQANPDLARRVNVDVTALLAGLAADIPFVFFSSDLVFDGRKGNYVETDAVNPIHVYGETKLAAEQIVLRNPRHTVVRTSLNGGISRAGNRGFNETVAARLAGGEGNEPVHGRISLPDFRRRDGACGLGTGESKARRAVPRCRRGKTFALANRPAHRGALAAAQSENHARLGEKFPGPPRALDTSLNIAKVQGVLSVPLPGLGEWLAANPNELF